MIEGVHLRQKTSSHSADLGTFYGGTIVKLLGQEAGDPFPWYRVGMGGLEGYMAGNYVGDAAEMGGMRLQDLYLLPVAETLKKTSLRQNTNLLAEKTADLPLGERMHILGERGDYWYAAVPEGEPGPFMDVNSQYGFIHKNDVRIAGTCLQLDWMQK